MNNCVFIGWSRNYDLAYAVKRKLAEKGFNSIVGGRNDAFADHAVSSTVIAQMNRCCSAILLFDKVQKEEGDYKLSENMLFEYGYLSGSLNPNRVFVIYLNGAKRYAPSDMEGMWCEEMDNSDSEVELPADSIVGQFLKKQHDSIEENKMILLTDISMMKLAINRHMTRPVYYDTEMAIIIMLYGQASYIHEDIDFAKILIHKFSSLTYELSDELLQAIDMTMTYFDICESLVFDESSGKMRLMNNKPIKKLKKCIDVVKQMPDSEFTYMYLMLANEYITFANMMYYTDNANAEERAQYADECMLYAEKFVQCNATKNKQFADLIVGYCCRNKGNLFKSFHDVPESSHFRLAQEAFEKSIQCRHDLLVFFERRLLNRRIMEQVRMEYNLALSDNLDMVSPSQRKKNREIIEDYLEDIEESAYNKKYLIQTIRDSVNQNSN